MDVIAQESILAFSIFGRCILFLLDIVTVPCAHNIVAVYEEYELYLFSVKSQEISVTFVFSEVKITK